VNGLACWDGASLFVGDGDSAVIVGPVADPATPTWQQTVTQGRTVTSAASAGTALEVCDGAGANCTGRAGQRFYTGPNGAVRESFNSSGTVVSTGVSNLGIEFEESDTNPACAAGNYTIYADLSETKLKACQNGSVSDLVGGGGAPTTATYITQTADGTLSAEQALSTLSTGIMRVATTTGVITSLTDSAGIAANVSDETGTGVLVFGTSPTFTTGITTPVVTSGAADPADAGAIRLGNGEVIGWEASPAGTDVTITVNASEQLAVSNQILTAAQGIEFTASDTNPTCSSGNYTVYADTSETTLKTCNNGVSGPLRPPEYILRFACLDADGVDDTNYLAVSEGNISCFNSEANVRVQFILPAPMHVAALYCEQTVAPTGAGQTATYTVRLAETSNTDCTCTMTNTAVTCNDTTCSTAFTAGQKVTVSQVINAGSADADNVSCSVLMVRD